MNMKEKTFESVKVFYKEEHLIKEYTNFYSGIAKQIHNRNVEVLYAY